MKRLRRRFQGLGVLKSSFKKAGAVCGVLTKHNRHMAWLPQTSGRGSGG